MRRISDGTKVNERYKTTDSLEKAFIEYQSYNYLYQDGEHYVFMQPETFEQIHVGSDHPGRHGAVSSGEHGSAARPVQRRARLHRDPRPRHPRDHRDRAGGEGPDRLGLLQARGPVDGVRTMVPTHIVAASASSC